MICNKIHDIHLVRRYLVTKCCTANELKTQEASDDNKHLLSQTVSVGQEFSSGLAGWLWLRIFMRPQSHLKASWGWGIHTQGR